MIHRYLKAREDIDENARLIANIIESRRGIDAVVIEPKDKGTLKQLLGYTDLSYCLLNVNGQTLLLYPNEQRERYMSLRPHLLFDGKMVEYKGFTYSEATAAKDFITAAGEQFQITTDENGRISFAISKRDEALMDQVISCIKKEAGTPCGEKHFVSDNICWIHAINQVSMAINYEGNIYLGREGGTGGILINKNWAYIVTPQNAGKITKNDQNFAKKLINAVLNDLDGAHHPIKAFYGDIVNEISYGMDNGRPSMSRQNALNVFGLREIPTIDMIGEMLEKSEQYNKRETEALYTLMRMSMCRSQKLESIDEYKMNKEEKKDYESMHNRNILYFESLKEKLYERSITPDCIRGLKKPCEISPERGC